MTRSDSRFYVRDDRNWWPSAQIFGKFLGKIEVWLMSIVGVA